MDPQTRITQFQRLIADDPNNDMAYFSLGNAFLQNEQFEQAGETFAKCAQINEAMTKAYQLAGDAYIKAGKVDLAKVVLTKGYVEATTRGDLMPKNAIADLLQSINEPIPEVTDTPKAETPAEPEGDFVCKRTGNRGTQLPRPPFRNELGKWIQDNISKQTFDEWIGMGTKIINELRLDLSRDDHDAVYDYAMRLHLGISDDLFRSLLDKDPPMPDGQYKGVVDDIMGRGGQLESEQGNLHTRVEE
jgi:Fe-S cluster biosynthesis and repair protein YggX